MKFTFIKISLVVLVFSAMSCSGKSLHKDAEMNNDNLGQALNRSRSPLASDTIGSASLLPARQVPWKIDNSQIESKSRVQLKPGDDLAAKFRAVRYSKDIKKIVFTPGDYRVRDTLHLPRPGGLVIIEGQGANLKASPGVPVFYSIPKDHSQAMNWNKTRYLIQNFGNITGGSRGVFIGSSFNTVIQNIQFIGQQEAAIDLVFCLMSSVKEVLVTNVAHDGIVLRTAVSRETGERVWPGTSFNNSQCNHTVLQSCRVYNKKGCSGMSFKVLQSTGVRLLDCISEGHPNKRAVFFDASKCTTAKFFSIQNFHLEHAPTDGAMVFRSNGSTVGIDGFFTQIGSKGSPTIWLMNNGNYVFKNIPWWPGGAWVKSSHSPSVVIQHCTKRFYNISENWKNAERPGEKIYPHYFRMSDKLIR